MCLITPLDINDLPAPKPTASETKRNKTTIPSVWCLRADDSTNSISSIKSTSPHSKRTFQDGDRTLTLLGFPRETTRILVEDPERVRNKKLLTTIVRFKNTRRERVLPCEFQWDSEEQLFYAREGNNAPLPMLVPQRTAHGWDYPDLERLVESDETRQRIRKCICK